MTFLPEGLLAVCGLALALRPSRGATGLALGVTVVASLLVARAPLAAEPLQGFVRDGWAVWCQLLLLAATASALALGAYTEAGWRPRTAGWLLLASAAGCLLAAATSAVAAAGCALGLAALVLLALRAAARVELLDGVWGLGAAVWIVCGLGAVVSLGGSLRLDWLAPQADGSGLGLGAAVLGVGSGAACALLLAGRTIARADVPAAFGAWLVAPLVAGFGLSARCAVALGLEGRAGLGVLAVVVSTGGHLLAARATSLKAAAGWLLVGQAGFLVLGLATVAPGELDAVAAPLLALVLVHAGLLGFVLVADNELGSSAYLRLAGLGRRNPWLGAWLGVLLAALLGLPPTLGFVGKLAVVSAALADGHLLASGLVLANVALVGWVLLRVIAAVVFRRAPRPEASEPLVASSGLTLVCAAFPLTLLWLGIGPAGLIGFTQRLQLLSG